MIGIPIYAEIQVNTSSKGTGAKSITAFDRVGERKLGGYFDTEYFYMNDDISTFKAHRFILQASSQVHERVLVNSEIEFKYGGYLNSVDTDSAGELKLEQAWADFALNDTNFLRAGILLVPFGIVNILHDSDVRDTTQRPLYAEYIVPTTWTDTGVGVHGTLDVAEAEVNYEVYTINGLAGNDFDDESGLRNLRPNFKQDNNSKPAMTGRVGISPFLGLEVGVSGYVGQHDDENGITLVGLDQFWKKGPFEIMFEWAKAHIDPDDSIGNVSGINGYYIESRYHFFPSFLKNNIIADGFNNPTFTLFSRFGRVDLDENNDTKGQKSRITIGMNYRPTDTVVFKVEGQLGYEESDAKKSESGIISSIAIGF